MSVKSIFVPENLLRDEIRVGYDQRGGEPEPEQESQAAEGGDTFDRAEENMAPADDPTDSADPAEPTDPAGPKDPEDPEDPTDLADLADPTDLADPAESVFKPDDDVIQPAIVDAIEDFDDDNDEQEGTRSEPDQEGGALFGSGMAELLQSLFTSSSSNHTLADLIEDGVYELSVIRTCLDSISQSLATIAEKPAGNNHGDRYNKKFNNSRDRENGRDRDSGRDRDNGRDSKDLPADDNELDQ